jgi:hypothetical protein
MDHTTAQLPDTAPGADLGPVERPSIGSTRDGVRTRHWGRHATWVTLDEDHPDTVAVAIGEIDRAGAGATVVVDLVDLDHVDPDRIAAVRASIERAVGRATHVVVVASALGVRHALVSADLDHLAPMPQSRRDAMAFLRSVLQPLSA